jgi:hypothetical protein
LFGISELIFLAAGAGILLIIVGIVSQMSRSQSRGRLGSSYLNTNSDFSNLSDSAFDNSPGVDSGTALGSEVGAASSDFGGSSTGESVGSDIGSSVDFGGSDSGGGDSGGGDSGGGDAGGGD